MPLNLCLYNNLKNNNSFWFVVEARTCVCFLHVIILPFVQSSLVHESKPPGSDMHLFCHDVPVCFLFLIVKCIIFQPGDSKTDYQLFSQ